ncbi:hypothetical protein B0J12DRAFT_610769 [Macrophomina phaseolina]|uniref:Rhodopsin domain-containing protein n=1 Tax=Macrophomina phaseolina TaxID=35725 RepID=A0ABQ8FUY8_9PEZI|nr:hypothetical protein B0J12DRAFT_610769 [Macrophomina phaseolina]
MTQYPSANVPHLTPEYRRRTLLAASICYALSVIAVVLRFAARKIARSGMWYDDWLSLTGLVFVGVFVSLVLVDLPGYNALHGELLPESMIIEHTKSVYISSLCYYTAQCSLKYSIIAFYWRIFNTTSIRIPIYFAAFSVTAWYIASFLVVALQCVPVAAIWTPSLASTAKCVELRPFFFGTSIPNILTDFFLLVLPIPYVWRLRITILQKLFVLGFLLLGGFVLIASIFRLHFLLKLDLKNYAINWTVQDCVVLSMIESCMGVVCVCLPSLRPIVMLLPCSSLLTPTSSSYPASIPKDASNQSHGLASRLGCGGAKRREDQPDEFELLDGAGGNCWVGKGVLAEERSDITTEVEGIAIEMMIPVSSSDVKGSGQML